MDKEFWLHDLNTIYDYLDGFIYSINEMNFGDARQNAVRLRSHLDRMIDAGYVINKQPKE